MLKLLVPVDGSESSNRCIDVLVRKAGWYREPIEVHLLNVQPPIVSGNVTMFIKREQLEEYYRDEGLKALAEPRRKLDEAKVPYVYHIGVGEPAETIAKYARDKQCDQIFMGTRGMGRVTGMLLGSVAAKVIHLSDVPVLLVK
ncbi:MAG: universal stress protein [Pseudomonadota bacterium]